MGCGVRDSCPLRLSTLDTWKTVKSSMLLRSDYYDGNIVEHSLEYHEEIGLCVKIKLHLNNFSMFQVNEDSEFRLALCLPIIIVFIFLR